MILIIPCFNEERRLDEVRFVESCKLFDSIIFVDDGSTDRTSEILSGLQKNIRGNGGQSELIALPKNLGKAEAVRRGILESLKNSVVGRIAITDADLSTPLEEMARLGRLLGDKQIDVLQGSRVQLAGRDIKRSELRHYVGRVAATLISNVLKIQVYDTQAGAKVFSRAAAEKLFGEKFVSRWLFDCEIFLRAKATGLQVYEEPLMSWRDVKTDSKVTPKDYIRSLLDLFRIRKAYRQTIMS